MVVPMIIDEMGRGYKSQARGHTIGKGERQDENPGNSTSDPSRGSHRGRHVTHSLRPCPPTPGADRVGSPLLFLVDRPHLCVAAGGLALAPSGSFSALLGF